MKPSLELQYPKQAPLLSGSEDRNRLLRGEHYRFSRIDLAGEAISSWECSPEDILVADAWISSGRSA
jgi:hypothetical protein